MTNSNRHPAGTSDGGKFAAKSREDSGVDLGSNYDKDKYGLPDSWTESTFEDSFDAYLDCAAWSSYDTDAISENEYISLESYAFSQSAKDELSEEYRDFIYAHSEMIDQANEMGVSPELVGHNFWLTRNGHGAGFWDSGLGELGEELSDASRVYGSVDLFINDQEEIDVA